jgi:hypothetical protein
MSSPRIHNSIPDHRHCHDDNRDAADDVRPYACPVPGCTRKFKRRFTLKEHIKTHTGEKSFTCPVPSCHKSFTTSGNLSRHKRLHPWLETSFECLIVGCGCTFASETKLERHMSMAHFGLSTHLCPHANCGSAFSTAGNLKRHLRHHHANDNGDGSLGMKTCSGEGKRDITSPIAVDRFTDSNTNGHGYGFAWTTSAPLEPMQSTTMRPVLLNDGDLLEALGFLFEPDSYTSESVIV